MVAGAAATLGIQWLRGIEPPFPTETAREIVKTVKTVADAQR